MIQMIGFSQTHSLSIYTYTYIYVCVCVCVCVCARVCVSHSKNRKRRDITCYKPCRGISYILYNRQLYFILISLEIANKIKRLSLRIFGLSSG